MKSALLALVGIATAANGAVTGANEFVAQVQKLSDKLSIPLPNEPVQSQEAIDRLQQCTSKYRAEISIVR